MRWRRLGARLTALGAGAALAAGCHTPWDPPDPSLRSVVLTFPLAGEVAAQRRVGGEVLRASSSPPPPPGSQSLADLPLRGGGQNNGDRGDASARSDVTPAASEAP